MVVAVDGGSERLGEQLEHVLLPRDLVDVADIIVRKRRLSDSSSVLGRELDEVVGHDESPAKGKGQLGRCGWRDKLRLT